jgi:hypothetical protein
VPATKESRKVHDKTKQEEEDQVTHGGREP